MTSPFAAVRVVLADDHPVFRAGLRRILEADPTVEVVGEAGTGDEALQLVHQHEPHVLLLDIDIPPPSGVEVARRLRAESSPVRVLILSAYDQPAFVRALLDAGAAGYITKGQGSELILEAVKAVARGEERWFVRLTPPTDELALLSERERDVLTQLAQGQSNEEIAEALHLSPHTVRNHLASVYAKLGVSSAREAVAWAWGHGVTGRAT